MNLNRLVLLVAAIVFPSTLFGQTVSGYFMTKPDGGGARNRMCLREGAGGIVAVKIATAYCPAGDSECYGVRLGEIEFESKLKGGHIRYVGKGRCEIDVRVTAHGAVISQRPECRDLYLNLAADGVYELIRRDVKSDDCEI